MGSDALVMLALTLAAKHGIPVAMRFIDKLVSGLPKGNPTKEEWSNLRTLIGVDFDKLV